MSGSPDPAGAEVRWIASYPKSGNTWVRFLVYQYFHGRAASSAEVSRTIPDVHRPEELRAAAASSGPIFAKTHWPRGPMLPLRERSRGAVYVVRHPRDTILSWISYTNMTARSATEIPSELQRVRNFIAAGGAPNYLRLGFGTWEENFRSWLDGAPFPVLLVRYEDLKSQPAVELRRIVGFFGHTPDEGKIAEAVRNSTFEAMRGLEASEKATGAAGALFVGDAEKAGRGQFFMNKGTSGGSLESIGAGLDKAVDERFAEAMKRFGY